MAGIWAEDYVRAKYHFAVAERMLKGYGDFEDKRFLTGVINEMARSASFLIRAYLLKENRIKGNAKENLNFFLMKIAPKYIDEKTKVNLFKVLEVQRAQKTSPIEFSKKGDIILLISGKYRFLTKNRIKELLDSVKTAVNRFPK